MGLELQRKCFSVIVADEHGPVLPGQNHAAIGLHIVAHQRGLAAGFDRRPSLAQVGLAKNFSAQAVGQHAAIAQGDDAEKGTFVGRGQRLPDFSLIIGAQ